MSHVVALVRFVWDFVVGDDPRIALWVTVGLLATLGLAHRDVSAWWLLPLVVAGVLVRSLFRASAGQRRVRPR